MANSTQTKHGQDAASSAMDTAKNVASSAAETAKNVASTVADKAREVASAAGRQADSVTGSVGQGVESLGSTVRSYAPHGGMAGNAASTVASGLESTGRYLQQEGLSGMASDLGDMIKRNPVPAVLIGVAVGFLLARVTTSSRSY
jgi:cell division septum initiation protein DivIVA